MHCAPRAHLQADPSGPPRPNVAYRRVTRHDYEIEWTLDQPAVRYDKKGGGGYANLANTP